MRAQHDQIDVHHRYEFRHDAANLTEIRYS